MRAEEHRSFAVELGVRDDQITGLDILSTTPDSAMLLDVDAVLVGGSGDFGVVHPHPPIDSLKTFLAGTTEKGFPMFASCFGFQSLVCGLGGSVIEDHEHAEVGTCELSCTDAASDDPIFRNLPRLFDGQVGHKDRADRLPDGAVNLVRSEACPYHAIHIVGTRTWATQFHPEMNGDDNRRRFMNYIEDYGVLFGEEDAKARLDGCRPSPEANSILRHFVRMLVD